MDQLSYSDLLGMPLDKAVLDYLQAQLDLSALKLRLGCEVLSSRPRLTSIKYHSDPLAWDRFTASLSDRDHVCILPCDIGL